MIDRRIICKSYAELENDIYFQVYDKNIICRLNSTTSEVEVVGQYEDEPYNIVDLAGKCIIAGDYCFFPPFRSSYIMIYDYRNKHTIYKSIDNMRPGKSIFSSAQYKFWNIAKIDHYVYMFGFEYPSIIRIDINTLNIEIISDWIQHFPVREMPRSEDLAHCYFGNGIVKYDRVYYIPAGVGSGVWKLDCINKKVEYIEIEADCEGFFSIGRFNDEFILSSIKKDDDKIYFWNPIDKKIRKVNLPISGFWHEPVVYEKNIYIFPWMDKSASIMINVNDYSCKVCKPINTLLTDEKGNKSGAFLLNYKNNFVTFIRCSDRAWITVNLDTFEHWEETYYLTDKDYLEKCEKENYDALFNNSINDRDVINERDIPLNEYIKRI